MVEGSKRQLKRLIRKYEFLLEDWEEVDEINKTANMEMSAELNKHRPPDIKPSDFESEWDDEKETESPERDAALKKLFRKIVVKCHPDKIPGDLSEVRTLELIDLYEKAIEAHDSQNWALMVIVAIKLEIDLPEEAEEKISEIEKDVEDLENKIEEATTSVPWQWYHSSEDLKEKIVENYLNLLQSKKKELQEKKIKDSIKPSKLILGLGHPRTGTGYTSNILRAWGVDVGHETLKTMGTIDWSLASGNKSLWQDLSIQDYEWSHLIYCLRNPKESIPSIVYTEESTKEFRRSVGVEADKNPVIEAINSICKWDELITNLNPSISYRIEDQGDVLYEYLVENRIGTIWNPNVLKAKSNVREHPDWGEMINEFGKIPEKYLRKINNYCKKYGYELI